jgi:hypothetical protein
MNFPSEPTLKNRLSIMANTFRYRLGAMVLLATLFLSREAPHFHVFSAAVCIWIAFEALVKFYIGTSRRPN